LTGPASVGRSVGRIARRENHDIQIGVLKDVGDTLLIVDLGEELINVVRPVDVLPIRPALPRASLQQKRHAGVVDDEDVRLFHVRHAVAVHVEQDSSHDSAIPSKLTLPRIIADGVPLR